MRNKQKQKKKIANGTKTSYHDNFLKLFIKLFFFISPQNGGQNCAGPSKAHWEICNSNVSKR